MITTRLPPNTLSRLVDDGYQPRVKSPLSINTTRKNSNSKESGKIIVNNSARTPLSSPDIHLKTCTMLISVLGSTPKDRKVSLDSSLSKLIISNPETTINLDDRAQIQIASKGFSILYYDRSKSKPSFMRFRFGDSKIDGDDWIFKIQCLINDARIGKSRSGNVDKGKSGDGEIEVKRSRSPTAVVPSSPPSATRDVDQVKRSRSPTAVVPSPPSATRDFWLREFD